MHDSRPPRSSSRSVSPLDEALDHLPGWCADADGFFLYRAFLLPPAAAGRLALRIGRRLEHTQSAIGVFRAGPVVLVVITGFPPTHVGREEIGLARSIDRQASRLVASLETKGDKDVEIH